MRRQFRLLQNNLCIIALQVGPFTSLKSKFFVNRFGHPLGSNRIQVKGFQNGGYTLLHVPVTKHLLIITSVSGLHTTDLSEKTSKNKVVLLIQFKIVFCFHGRAIISEKTPGLGSSRELNIVLCFYGSAIMSSSELILALSHVTCFGSKPAIQSRGSSEYPTLQPNMAPATVALHVA